MVFGPCSGVRDDLSCELGDRPCPFATAPPVRWTAEPVESAPLAVPLVLTDLTVRPYDPASVREVVRILAPVSDGLLVGEHQNRPDLPPTLFAGEVLDAGGRPWTTLTCRDRNRIVLEQELVGLGTLGVDGVPVAVPEAPDAPPVGLRPARVADKQRAGAGLCVLNHVAAPVRVAEFVASARAAGATLPFVAAVAVYTDERSARVLQRFPGLRVDPVAIEAVLTAPDPLAAGIAAAVTEARTLLAVPGVAGVNLSGLASGRGERAAAEVKAAVAAEIRAEVAA